MVVFSIAVSVVAFELVFLLLSLVDFFEWLILLEKIAKKNQQHQQKLKT